MANEFDPYREALVMEESTVWPDEFDEIDLEERQQLERLLHAAPEEAAEMAYHRTHTGFTREITVTDEDLARVRQGAS